MVEHHRPSSRLNVIAVVSNPVMFRSRYELFKNFQEYMAGQDVNLVVVELAFGGRNFEVTSADNPNHVQVRSHSELWHKENLVNLGFQALPPDWEYAAWVDADIEFLNPNWVHDTVNALQHHRVVQMFQDCVDTGPSGETMQVHRGFGFQYSQGNPMPLPGAGHYGYGYTFPHPGYCWAIRRSAFDGIGRLIDFAILGAGDHHMAWAFVGDVRKSIPAGLHRNYVDQLLAFESRAEHFIQRDVGYVPGTIIHHFHGKKKDRKYVERWSILVENDYNPQTDIKYNHHGALELDGRNVKLRESLRHYFRQRNEDSVDSE